MTLLTIDLNCDMGEFEEPDRLAAQERLMPLFTSISVACGGHAGTRETMRHTVQAALAHGCAVGAHPGFKDADGFGRRDVSATAEAIEQLIIEQLHTLGGVAATAGATLRHIKPHGALYARAASDPEAARGIVRAIRATGLDLIVVGLSGGQLIAAARAEGLAAAEEVFLDRAYRRDGTLVPRDRPNALIVEPTDIAARLHTLVRDGTLRAEDGTTLHVRPDTLCLHFDTPNAEQLASTARAELLNLGVQIASMRGQ